MVRRQSTWFVAVYWWWCWTVGQSVYVEHHMLSSVLKHLNTAGNLFSFLFFRTSLSHSGFTVCFLRHRLAWLNNNLWLWIGYISYFTVAHFKMTVLERPLENDSPPLCWESSSAPEWGIMASKRQHESLKKSWKTEEEKTGPPWPIMLRASKWLAAALVLTLRSQL